MDSSELLKIGIEKQSTLDLLAMECIISGPLLSLIREELDKREIILLPIAVVSQRTKEIKREVKQSKTRTKIRSKSSIIRVSQSTLGIISSLRTS